MPRFRISDRRTSDRDGRVLRHTMSNAPAASRNPRATRRLAAVSTVALLAACTAYATAPPPGSPGASGAVVAAQARGDLANRCRTFAGEFAELAACQRADGTLETFGDERIAWRVRYFFRYWQMPCQEAPTRNESYVFDLAANDLYGDRDLNDSQRVAIRNAMFAGRERCR